MHPRWPAGTRRCMNRRSWRRLASPIAVTLLREANGRCQVGSRGTKGTVGQSGLGCREDVRANRTAADRACPNFLMSHRFWRAAAKLLIVICDIWLWRTCPAAVSLNETMGKVCLYDIKFRISPALQPERASGQRSKAAGVVIGLLKFASWNTFGLILASIWRMSES
jgi:hypothetical protein